VKKRSHNMSPGSDHVDKQLSPPDELMILEKGVDDSEATDFVLTATDEDGMDYGPDHPPGELLDWTRLRRPLRPRIWIMKGWLTTVPTLFAARGGTGKSLQAQTMCTAIATGKDHIGVVEKARTCLIWSCEDDVDEILRRQDGINRYFGVKDSDLGRLHINPRIGLENSLMDFVDGKLVATPVLEILRQQVNDLKAEVLVLDNVAHLYGGLDDRTQVTKFVSTITGLVTGRPFAPIFVTHVSKMQGSEYTGSIAWENAVRMRWLLENGDDQDLKQHIGKSNVSGKLSIALRIVNSVVVPKSPGDVLEAKRQEMIAKAKREEYVESILVDGFEMLEAAGTRIIAKNGSREGLVRRIIELKEDKGATKKELDAGMSRLEMAKCVESAHLGNKYVNGDRIIEVTKVSARNGLRMVAA
jgi:hypothetical protein